MDVTVPFDDRGLTLGVGLFETMLVVDGEPQLWEAHADRLRRGCAALGLPAPEPDGVWAESRTVLQRAGLDRGRAALRLTWTGGSGTRGLAPPEPAQPRLLIAAAKAPAPPPRVALATSEIRRSSTSPAARMKTLSYLDNVEARRRAVAAGADEALLLNEHGHVASCAAANVFWLDGDRLCTAPLASGVLDGVVRGLVIAVARDAGWTVQEIAAPVQHVRAARGAFVTNSLIGAVDVVSLDGAPLPPVDDEVRRLLAEARARAGSG